MPNTRGVRVLVVPSEQDSDAALELMIGSLCVHKWEQQKNRLSVPIECDYWDCSCKIQPKETYYYEMHPGGHVYTYCLECSAFFLAQALNGALDEIVRLRGTK